MKTVVSLSANLNYSSQLSKVNIQRDNIAHVEDNKWSLFGMTDPLGAAEGVSIL